MTLTQASMPPQTLSAHRQTAGLKVKIAVLAVFSCLLIHLVFSGIDLNWSELLFSESDLATRHRLILLQIRLPRALLCALIGAGLSAAGVLTQGLFRNPIASPSIIGSASGAVLFAVLLLFLWPTPAIYASSIAGFFGALIVTASLLIVIQKLQEQSIHSLLLIGFAINLLLNSFISLLLALSLQDYNLTPKVLAWMLGSFNGKSWLEFFVASLFLIPAIFWSQRLSYQLNLLGLGIDVARSLGVNWQRLRWGLLICIAISVGTSVSLAGMIPFVGLVIPHIARSLVGPEHRQLLRFSCLLGACFCLLADILAQKLLYPAELQVGVLISLIGAPVFISLLWRDYRRSE